MVPALIRISLDLPDRASTVPLCRRTLRFVLGELAAAPDRIADIELAITEATSNVIRHAYEHPGHQYRVEVEILPSCVRLVIEDDGRGFHREAVASPDAGQTGGWGVWMIEQLADEFAVKGGPGGGCRVTAEFSLPQPLRLIALPDDAGADG